RALADLTAAHDYYTDTKIAWDTVRQVIAAGQTFSVRNMTTGTVTTQADLAAKARGYVAGQLAEATFQQFISIFENYFFGLLRLWLMAYPRNLSGRKVDCEDILGAPDKDAITAQVVSRELNDILYKRPTGWFEAKASRDVLVHNGGVASKTHGSKAGKLARYKDGQRIDIPEHYHRETWE